MSIKDLKIKMKQKPKLIKEIKNNKNPILLDSSVIDKMPVYQSIGMEVLTQEQKLLSKVLILKIKSKQFFLKSTRQNK